MTIRLHQRLRSGVNEINRYKDEKSKKYIYKISEICYPCKRMKSKEASFMKRIRIGKFAKIVGLLENFFPIFPIVANRW